MSTEFSLISLILHADLIVKCVMLLLLVASIFSWRVIFRKFLMLRSCKRVILAFKAGLQDSCSLAGLLQGVGEERNLVSEALRGFLERMNAVPGQCLSGDLKQRQEKIINLQVNKVSAGLEKELDFLATTASAAPFIGLFGTVWGIMHSFQAIGALKSVVLTVVAPSIGEALLATAIGLFVAIPALIFYNYLSVGNAQIIREVENLMWEVAIMVEGEDESNT